jgi:pullulanase
MEKEYKNYQGNDLGMTYTPEKTLFRVWAPTAERVQISFFAEGDDGAAACSTGKASGADGDPSNDSLDKADMKQSTGGTWIFEKTGNLDKVYYTYLVTIDGVTKETADPYARAVGVNGRRSMVVDLSATDPDGFEKDRGPCVASPTDAVICEVSVADITNDSTSGVRNKGKFLGLAEIGTKSPEGMKTGLDYLKDLGVTHLQLMPIYDFGSIDESDTESEQYNWGYDPVNYNVPEGSYATDPFHGEVRIREAKTMIQAIHAAGMGVVMDVVYNHTYDIDGSCFQKTAPDYFYRKTHTHDGNAGAEKPQEEYSNASGCGNEIATEREMVRKYIIDSLVYWATEYHIDGFRFDLMGVFDLETMQLISDTLRKIRPDILLYGEGWTGGASVYPEAKRAVKANVSKLNGVGAFSDDIRDGIRGHVFSHNEPGFVNGKPDMENNLRFSIAGASMHPQVDYASYTYTASGPWAKNPADVVNYISCHDNLTLWDKQTLTCPDAAEEELLSMNRLGAAILFTSQGIPFFLSGEEFGRTKPIEGSRTLCENSYNQPKYTNNIRYDRAFHNRALVAYYRGLIDFRKSHHLLRLAASEEVRQHLRFLDGLPKNVVAYTLTDETETIFIVYNANPKPISVKVPSAGAFAVYITGTQAGTEVLDRITGVVTVQARSALAAVSEISASSY